MEASQESTEVTRIITVTLDNLEEVGGALLEIQRLGAEGVVHRSLLRSTGSWRRENMAVAWELYFQEQGLAPHVRCEHEHWAVMEELNIPDVDFLKGLYANVTVRLKPGGGQSKADAGGSTVTFDTGVAQGSALSPLLFLIFMNTLLRLLTAKGRELGISHGLEGVDQFNNMAFADDLSLFAQSTGDMQVLLDEVQKFEAWSGLKVNRDKTCALIAGVKSDTTQQRTGLSYNGSAIRILRCDEACRYLGLWSTANGDMSEMKERVRKKTQEAIDLMKHHPLTPKMAIELFTSIE
jgi:hypothetical protein